MRFSLIQEKRKILYLQYTNPAGYPPLEHSSQILALVTDAFGEGDRRSKK